MEIFLQEFNEAQDVSMLFIHGGGLSGWMWDKQIKALNDFHCLVPDLPGHGKSRELQIFSIKECAQLMAALIKSKGHHGKAHVVGHSIGAQILLQLLADSPEVVHTGVVHSALVRSLWGVSSLIKPTVKLTLPLTRKKWFAKLQAQTLSIPAEYFPRYYEESKSISAETLAELLRENAAFKLPEGLENNPVPTLVLVGEKERGVMIRSAQDLVSFLPHAEGYIVQSAGHGFNFEDPVLYNEILQAWLAESRLPTGSLKRILKP